MENIDLEMEFANVLVIDRLTADAIGPANARIYYLIGNAVYLLQSYLTECFRAGGTSKQQGTVNIADFTFYSKVKQPIQPDRNCN